MPALLKRFVCFVNICTQPHTLQTSELTRLTAVKPNKYNDDNSDSNRTLLKNLLKQEAMRQEAKRREEKHDAENKSFSGETG